MRNSRGDLTVADGMSETIRVDVWSDIACPWCFLGKHRFEAGLQKFAEKFPEVFVEVESHSFELAPDTPVDFSGSEIDFLVKHKGMAVDQVEAMLEQMSELGAAEGVDLNFAQVRHTNTHRAHRVLHLAKEQGLQAELQERLFRAYFSEGVEIADPEQLARLGEEVGLDGQEVIEALDDEGYGDEVERDITRARMLGVTGVPYFLLEEKYAVPGAQSAETFASVLERVLQFQRSGTGPDDEDED